MFGNDLLVRQHGTDALARAHGYTDYAEYLATAHWRGLRRWMLTQAGHRCEWVDDDRGRCHHRRRLHVHHLTYERFGAEHPDDLAVLCQPHHNEAHGRTPDLAVRRPWVDPTRRAAAVAAVVAVIVVVLWVAHGRPPLPAVGDLNVDWDGLRDAAGPVVAWLGDTVALFARVLAGLVVELVEWVVTRLGER